MNGGKSEAALKLGTTAAATGYPRTFEDKARGKIDNLIQKTNLMVFRRHKIYATSLFARWNYGRIERQLHLLCSKVSSVKLLANSHLTTY